MTKIRNGERWKQPRFPYCEGISQWLHDDCWCFMSVPESGIEGWPVSMPISDAQGRLFYTKSALHDRLTSKGYEPTDMKVEA